MDLSSTTNWESAGVCQRHFRDEDYMTADINNKGQPRKRMRLKPDAVPRVFDTTGFPAGCLPKVSEPRETKLATAREVMNNDLGMSLLNCEKGCSLVDTIVPAIARSLFHVMAKNMVSKANSDVHTKVKRSDPDASAKATRSKSDYKKQKFSSEKKSYV